MPWDWGTIGSIAFGGLISTATPLIGVAFKERMDRARLREVEQAEVRTAARFALVQCTHAVAYLSLALHLGRWPRGGNGFPIRLADEQRAALARSLSTDNWWALEEASIAISTVFDLRDRSAHSESLGAEQRPLIEAAVDRAEVAVKAIAPHAGIEPSAVGKPSAMPEAQPHPPDL